MPLSHGVLYAKAHWRMDETSGTRADSIGSNHLTDVNTVTSVAGMFGNAASMLSTNSEALQVADTTDLSIADNDATLTFWLKWRFTGGAANIVGKAGTSHGEWQVLYSVGSDRLVLQAWGSSGFGNEVTVTANTFGSMLAVEDEWVLVVIKHDAVNNLIGISINGGAFDTGALTGGIYDSTTPFAFGRYPEENIRYSDQEIDDAVFIKGYAFTSDDVTALWNSGDGIVFDDWDGTAFPTILFNSSGSDTAASGAGPASAITGSAASTSSNGLVVTLDGSPDLTPVAFNGSHVIYLADATAGNRNFAKITAVDNSAKTVTVANPFGTSLSGLSWAIGGKRDTLMHTDSQKLFNNNTAEGDLKAGWTVELESGFQESNVVLSVRCFGNTTDGFITVKGTYGAATRPSISSAYTQWAFNHQGSGSLIKYANIDFIPVTECFGAIQGNNKIVENCKITNPPGALEYYYYGFSGGGLVKNCDMSTVSISVHSGDIIQVYGCIFRGVGCVPENVTRCFISHCLFVEGARLSLLTYGDGYKYFIDSCTIVGSTSEGIIVTDGGHTAPYQITNCIVTDSGDEGVYFGQSEAAILGSQRILEGNNLHNNTAGACNRTGLFLDNPNLDPDFERPDYDDYTPTNTGLSGAVFPAKIGLLTT